MKVVAYIRVSTEKQTDVGCSLEVQREKVALYAKLHDLELSAIIEDAGESAKSLHRLGLQKALSLLKPGDALLVTKLDRLTRSLRDLDTLITAYFDKGIALMSASESIDTSTANGRMVLNILTSVAQWEREKTVERTKEAAAHKKAKGERFGKVAYGMTVAEDGKTLVPEPREQEVIGVVQRLHKSGASLRQIAAELDRLGYRNRSGQSFLPTQINRMLA
jgi:DNA invertase Pin-like site-specific DNA recombinase